MTKALLVLSFGIFYSSFIIASEVIGIKDDGKNEFCGADLMPLTTVRAEPKKIENVLIDMLTDADRDNSKTISVKEAKAGHIKRSFFLDIDKNKDWKLTPYEVNLWLKDRVVRVFDTAFDRYDYNEDGFISFEETKYGIYIKRKQFDKIDSNGDGYLDRKELFPSESRIAETIVN